MKTEVLITAELIKRYCNRNNIDTRCLISSFIRSGTLKILMQNHYYNFWLIVDKEENCLLNLSSVRFYIDYPDEFGNIHSKKHKYIHFSTLLRSEKINELLK
jgi:hypothetical protein